MRKLAFAVLLCALPACAYRGGLGPAPARRPNVYEDRGRVAASRRAAPPVANAYAEPSEPEVSVETSVDEFTGRRTVVFDTEAEWETAQRMPRATIHIIASPDGMVGFLISSAFPDWHWLRCHTTHALLDQAPVALRDVDHDGSAASTGRSVYVHEHVEAYADEPILDRLLHVESLRIRICTDVLRVPESSLDELRQVPILAAEARASTAWAEEATENQEATTEDPGTP